MSWRKSADLSKVPLAKLAAELARRASEDTKPLAVHEEVALDLARAIRKLGFYAQVWLPQDVRDKAEGLGNLTEDQQLEALRLMEKNDEAAMVANSELLDEIVSYIVSEREESEEAR